MKIVVDTNVLVSGVFFGGYPRRVLASIVRRDISACASVEIITEYQEIVDEMIDRKQGHIDHGLLAPLIEALDIIHTSSDIKVCRDPDDDKFINCAKDARALYIVSGDKDLLVLRQYEDIQIVTAKEFCTKYL